MGRDLIIARINAATEALAVAREAGDRDALEQANADLAIARNELAAYDALNGGTVPAAPKAVARHLADDEGVDGLIERTRAGEFGTINIQRGDVFTGTGVSGAQDVLTPDTDRAIEQRLRPELTFLDVATVLPTDSDTVKYFIETGFVNNAGPVPRRSGGNYGKYNRSHLTVEPATANVIKIGHTLRTDEDTLADAPAMESLINIELPYGVREEVQAELLADADTVNGLPSIAVVGAGRAQLQTYSLGSNEKDLAENALIAVRRAKTKGRRALHRLTWVLVSPTAEEIFELAQNGNGDFRAGSPFVSQNAASIWGLRRIVCDALEDTVTDENPLGKMVAGQSATWRLRTRTGVEVTTSTNVDDDFEQDAVVFKARQRVAVENRRPEGIVVVAPTGVYGSGS